MVYLVETLSFFKLGSYVSAVDVFTVINENCKEMELEFGGRRVRVFGLLENLSVGKEIVFLV